MSVVPRDLFRFMPFLPNTFEKAEKEYAAALVILWHYEMKHDDWTPVSPKALIDWAMATDLPMVKDIRNSPFCCPDLAAMMFDGYVDGWRTQEEAGTFTPKGLARLEALVASHP